MSQLLTRSYSRSSTAPEWPLSARIPRSQLGDYDFLRKYVSGTLMSQWSNTDAYQRSEAVHKTMELKYAVLIPTINFLTQQIGKNTQHRAVLPGSLFTHMYTRVENAETMDDVVDVLNFFKFVDVAKRLVYLRKVAEEEDEGIELQSLRNFAMFVVREWLPTPQIGINLDGLIQAVWRPPHFGTLIMNFLKSGDIMFTGLYSQEAPGSRRRKISGVLPPHLVMQHIDDFVLEMTVI